jgi:VWFA-related protein
MKVFPRFVLAVLCVSGSVFSQAPQPAAPSPPKPQQEEPFRIVTRISVVDLAVTFVDSAGTFLTNIRPADVTLTDNGVVQEIQTFDATLRPISMVILVDTSSRLDTLLPNLRKSGILFTQLVMGGTGEAAVLTYDQTVDVRQDFTNNDDLVEQAFQDLKCQGDETHLTDGVFRALSMLKSRPEERRRVIVILGDGLDQAGENRRTKALAEAQLANVSIYTVQLSGFKSMVNQEGPEPLSSMPPGAVPHEPGVPYGTNTGASGFSIGGNVSTGTAAIKGVLGHPMKAYSDGTGSGHVNATNIRAVENAVQQIGSELHSQYWLSYKPNNLGNNTNEAEFHTIVVKVKQRGITVRNRPGYFYMASADDVAPKK